MSKQKSTRIFNYKQKVTEIKVEEKSASQLLCTERLRRVNYPLKQMHRAFFLVETSIK